MLPRPVLMPPLPVREPLPQAKMPPLLLVKLEKPPPLVKLLLRELREPLMPLPEEKIRSLREKSLLKRSESSNLHYKM